MKTKSLLTLVACLCAPFALAEDKKEHDHDHDHDHAKITGPNKGRILHEVDPHAELFVTKDRKLQVTFVDHDGKAIAPGEQSISVICGKRTAPTRMKFEKKGGSLLSDKALPDGMLIPTVLQIKMAPSAKSTVIRLNLNLEECPSCDSLEYACTCDHHHDE